MIIMDENDESRRISAKSWARAADSISKVGFMDGASDGQSAALQTSFDKGYKQGFQFGLKLGAISAASSFQNTQITQLRDQRRINCQMCLNSISSQENIVNLFNKQKEENDLFLSNVEKINKLINN